MEEHKEKSGTECREEEKLLLTDEELEDYHAQQEQVRKMEYEKQEKRLCLIEDITFVVSIIALIVSIVKIVMF